jgi:hypothetical protein
MAGVLTSLQRLKDGCLGTLASHFARWTKPLETSLPLSTLCAGYLWHPSASIGLWEPHMLSLAPCRFLGGRVQLQALTRSSSLRGNVYCAWDSHLFHAVGRSWPSVAPPSLRHLDQTRHHLAATGDADRPFQEQVRAGGRKCAPSPATHHPPATGETTCLQQIGPVASGASGQDSSEVETSHRYCPARDAPVVASTGVQALLEIQVQSHFCRI